MKKMITLGLMAAAIATASAQYTINPSTSAVAEKGAINFVDYIVLSDAGVAELEKAGAKINYIGPDPENGFNLWIWENTFNAVAGGPRVDMEEGEAINLEVANVGWSGAGFDCQGLGVNTKKWSANTRFHLAYETPTGNAPASTAIILMDGKALAEDGQTDLTSAPAKVALGTAFDDNGAIFPAVGPEMTDDWQAIDLSLGDLKKLYPSFSPVLNEYWTGNILSFLAGGVAGKTIAFDAIYFYELGESGVEGVAADAEFVLGANTLNSTVAGITVYDLQGRAVKSTASTVLGINDLAAGVYVAKSGAKTYKFVVK